MFDIGEEEWFFFNPEEAATIDALVEAIIPGEEDSPGASQAGVTRYIDRVLAGFARDLQDTYREGLLALAEFTATVTDRPFAEADPRTRDQLVAALNERGGQSADFLGQFFRIVREHTVQGFFGDPAYGGNEDLAGWKLVGFPGAQWAYTEDQMRPGFDARSIPMVTIKDLYRRVGKR